MKSTHISMKSTYGLADSTPAAEIVFVRLLIPFSIGIISCIFITSKLTPYLLSAAALIFSCLGMLHTNYLYLKVYPFKKPIAALFYLLIFILGMLSGLLNKQSSSASHFAKQKCRYLTVVIDEEPMLKDGIVRFNTRVVRAYRQHDEMTVCGRLQVAFKPDPLHPLLPDYGDELMIPARFTAIEPPYNPSEFDVQQWLAAQNIYHQTFLMQTEVIRLSTGNGNPLIKYALKLREKQLLIYRRLIRNREAFAVASTLILGYRSDLSMETLNAYSKTGTIHALSVSGMHVGIIYIVLNRLLFFLNRKKGLRLFKLMLILLLIWFYSLLTGFCPAILRSAIMLSVFILAKFFQKDTNSANVLAFTAFCLLLYNPFLIWDVGFQLSFISVFGLIYLQPKIYRLFHFSNKWADRLWNTIALSIAAQVVTFPLGIYYFHQFPFYFLVANLFIGLPVTAMMYLGLAILLFRAYFLAPVFEWIINFTDRGLTWISTLPFSTLSAIWISKTELGFLSLALFLLMSAIVKQSKKLLFISLGSFLIFQCLLVTDKLQARQQQEIIFFSLKKNYAAAFIFSDTAILLTDLNAREKAFNSFIKPALDQHKIKQVQFVNWNSIVKTTGFVMSRHQITFHQYNILKFDTYFNHKEITGKPAFDLIWLHDSPGFNPTQLRQQLRFKIMIADAGNKPYLLKHYTDSINIFHSEYHILKKNKAYLINLN